MRKKRKIITLIVTIVVVAGLAIWINSRWDAWFSNTPEAPYTVSTAPTRVLLTFGNDGENSRMVSWMCDTVVDKNACLLLVSHEGDTTRIPAKGEVFESRSGKAAYYRAEINSDMLNASTSHNDCVETNGKKSPWYHFTVSDTKGKAFSFMYIGDVQDTINGIANKLFKSAIKAHPEVEFVAFGGDLIERPTDAYYGETFRTIDSICTAMPIVNVTGNHDYLKYLIRKCERRFALTFPYFLKGMDERNDNNHLFSFEYHDTQFFLLDTDRGIYFLYQQRNWLEKQLNESKAKHKVVIAHHPLYSVRNPKNNLEVRYLFNDLIKDYGVELVLQGHEHGYTRCTSDEAPLKSNECTMLPLYVISHCSPKNYELKPDERFYPVLNNSRYYQIITVAANDITLKSYDAISEELLDSVIIRSKR